MLRDYLFSQRNKATKRVVGVEVGGNGGYKKFEKGTRRDRQYKIGSS